MMKFIQLVCSQ